MGRSRRRRWQGRDGGSRHQLDGDGPSAAETQLASSALSVRRRRDGVSQCRLQLLLRAHDAALRQLRRAVHLRTGARSLARRRARRRVLSRLRHRHLQHRRTGRQTYSRLYRLSTDTGLLIARAVFLLER